MHETMRTNVIFSHPGFGYAGISRASADVLPPDDNEISVVLHACSINYRDVKLVKTGLPVTSPRIPLSDGAGQVVMVGKKVKQFKRGDKVISTFFPDWLKGEGRPEYFRNVPGDTVDGYAREQVTAAANAFTLAPIGWDYVESATLPTAGVAAWNALVYHAHLRKSDTVLVQGSGGLATFVVLFSKMMGATVIGVSSTDKRCQRLNALGADVAINYNVHKDWWKIVRQVTKGRGARVIIDVGGSTTLPQSIAAVSDAGIICVLGSFGHASSPLNVNELIGKRVRMVGVRVGSRECQDRMVRALNSGSVRPPIDRVFPIECIIEALSYVEKREHVGKVVLKV